MNLTWIWYGFLIILCLFLMLGVMWLTDRAIEFVQCIWVSVFKPLDH